MMRVLLAVLGLSVLVGCNAHHDLPKVSWFFEVSYPDERVLTFPVYMDSYEVALPYNGRVLKTEIPKLVDANNEWGHNLQRRFMAAMGDDVLSADALCDLDKSKKAGTEGGEGKLLFKGGSPSATPSSIRLYCVF